jgi:hypothetical protein
MLKSHDSTYSTAHKKLATVKLGDAIATVATPIARALNMPCIDPVTNQLRPESTCAKTKQALNEGRYLDAFNQRFFSRKNGQQQNKETNQMADVTDEVPFQIVLVLNAKNVEDALARFRTEGITKSVNPIPQPQQVPGRVVTGGFQQSTTAAVPALPTTPPTTS